MIVDDRLETVLRTQAAGRAGRNTQARQLVDILGRTPASAWTDSHDRALARLDSLHGELGDAAVAVLVGLCTPRSPRLVAHLVTLGPRTALAAIGRARLSDDEWLRLVPALPIHARGALRHRRDLSPPVLALLDQLGVDDFVLSAPAGEAAAIAPDAPPEGVPVSLPTQSPPRAEAVPREGIGAIVRRIEAFRRNRDSENPDRGSHDAPRPGHPLPGQQPLPFADIAAIEAPAGLIDIAFDAAGTIIAAEGVDPAMLVGHAPFAAATPAAAASVDPGTLTAFRARLPILAGRIMLDGAARIAGVWRIDAVPHFGADGGQFTGYRARLRRPPMPVSADREATVQRPNPGADALHQLLHELRTPINAIQGFAELIQQQLIGPTPHQYRSLAASIAADAARMLAGFEDVERLVRLETGRTTIEPGETDLAAIITRMVAQLEPLTGPREIRLRWSVPSGPVPIAMAPDEAERTLWRLLSTLVTAAAPGERLSLALDFAEGSHAARLKLTLPQALALRDDAELFAPDVVRGGGMPGMGMLGHGFALRLCDAELRAAGGALHRPGAASSPLLDMTFPLAVPVALDRNAVAS
jgi:signal transduction histidine kinase